MKNLFLIIAMLIAATTLGQTKVRYWTQGSNLKYTVDLGKVEFPYYKLGYQQGDDYVTGWELYRMLKEPIWPDVAFAVYFPVYLEPEFHYAYHWEQVPTSDSTYVMKEISTKVWDVSPETVQAMKNLFEAKLKQYFVILQKVEMRHKVPKGDDIRWQYVWPEKPYRQRFGAVHSEPFPPQGKSWQPTNRDLWGDFIDHIMSYPDGWRRLKAISNTIQR